MKKKRKWIAIIAGAVVLVAAAGYTVFIAPLLEKEQWVYKESTVERGTLTAGVSESGTLEYGISSILYDLNLDVTAESEEESSSEEEDTETGETVERYLQIEEIYAVPGQRISEGDALIKFTEDSVEDVRRLLESAVVDARSDYNDAESEYQLSALEAQTTYDTKMVEEKYASSIYNNASAAVTNEIETIQVEIQQRNANIPLLEEKLSEATEDYNEALEDYNEAKAGMEQADTAHTENFMTFQRAYISAESQYQNAKTALETAQQNVEDNADEITSLEKELAVAKAKQTIDQLDTEEEYLETVIEGDNAEISYQAELESLKETLSEAEETKNQLEEQLQAFEEFVGEEGILYADGSGIVTQLNYEAGDSLVETGAVISYASPQDMTISVDVTQEDVVELAVGDSVDIAFTAYEEVPYEGTILSIDTTATSESSKTISYQVVIGVEGDTKQLYGGMTADITFVTEEKEDVLYVSRNAIVEENGRTYVYRRTDSGGRELTEVETGMSNGVNIEIISGLSEGDTIYIASRVSSEEEVENSAQDAEQEQTDSTALPGGMELPEGMEPPEGMESPEGMELPQGMEAPEGLGGDAAASDNGSGGGQARPDNMGREAGE